MFGQGCTYELKALGWPTGLIRQANGPQLPEGLRGRGGGGNGRTWNSAINKFSRVGFACQWHDASRPTL